jgi:hypothetical protein
VQLSKARGASAAEETHDFETQRAVVGVAPAVEQ